MTDTSKRMIVLFALFGSMAAPAHAYLDPATGSIILQAIVGAVGTWLVYSRLFMAKAKATFAKVFGRTSDVSAEAEK